MIASGIAKSKGQTSLEVLMASLNTLSEEVFTARLIQLIPELKMEIAFEQNNPHHYLNVYDHTIKACRCCSDAATVEVKVAILLHDIGKPYCYTEDEQGIGHFYGHSHLSASIAQTVLKRLEWDETTTAHIIALIEHHDRPIEARKKSIRRALKKISYEVFEDLLEVKKSDASAQVYDEERLKVLEQIKVLYKEILEEEKGLGIKDLAVEAKDIIDALQPVTPQAIGVYLKEALKFVQENPSRNNKPELLAYLKQMP